MGEGMMHCVAVAAESLAAAASHTGSRALFPCRCARHTEPPAAVAAVRGRTRVPVCRGEVTGGATGALASPAAMAASCP
eukprot:128205-Chlamydomonas_euryale.AAC.1